MGTKGEIRGHEGKREIEVIKFRSNVKQDKDITIHKIEIPVGGHSGGDNGLMNELFRLLENKSVESLSSGSKSLQSHLMAFGAEEARKNNIVVQVK